MCPASGGHCSGAWRSKASKVGQSIIHETCWSQQTWAHLLFTSLAITFAWPLFVLLHSWRHHFGPHSESNIHHTMSPMRALSPEIGHLWSTLSILRQFFAPQESPCCAKSIYGLSTWRSMPRRPFCGSVFFLAPPPTLTGSKGHLSPKQCTHGRWAGCPNADTSTRQRGGLRTAVALALLLVVVVTKRNDKKQNMPFIESEQEFQRASTDEDLCQMIEKYCASNTFRIWEPEIKEHLEIRTFFLFAQNDPHQL